MLTRELKQTTNMKAATRARQFWTNNDTEFVLYGKNVSPSTGKLMFIMFTEIRIIMSYTIPKNRNNAKKKNQAAVK